MARVNVWVGGLMMSLAASAWAQPIRPVTLQRDGASLVRASRSGESHSAAARVVVADGWLPVALLSSADHAPGAFTLPRRIVNADVAAWRAWLIDATACDERLGVVPAGAELRAGVDSFGPGKCTAWIAAGGARVGDSWWIRRNGQPLARFDVRCAAAGLAFCRVLPLAADAELSEGDELLAWPSLGDRAAGRCASAVSFVDLSGASPLLWIAAPRAVAVPAEPQVDFFREGRYLAHGAVERSDTRFWYVRLLESAIVETPRVGDEARIRTLTDVRDRRFVARVFAESSEGRLITAGEPDGIRTGQEAAVWRDGRPIGVATVVKVQGGYGTLGPLRAESGETLQRMDEVRFAPPPAAAGTIARIESVTDEFAMSVRIVSAVAPVQRFLAIRDAGRTVGVGVILAADRERGVAFAFADTLMEPLRAGLELALDEVAAAEPRSSGIGDR